MCIMKAPFSHNADGQCPGILNTTEQPGGELVVTMWQSHQSKLIYNLLVKATSLR